MTLSSGDAQPVSLSSEALAVTIRADKGADLCSLVDRRTGIDVLWKTPWTVGDPIAIPWTGDSQTDWLARYPGGWQQLVPNAGPERMAHGVRQGYHGEAAIRPWSVLDVGPHSAVLSVDLFTVPVRLTRSVHVDGDRVLIDDEMVNLSGEELDVRWVQHPGFGAPFIDEHCIIETGATTFLSDADAPGSVLAPDAVSRWPRGVAVDGSEVDLRRVPAEPGSVFGALTDFAEGWFAVDSPTTGLVLRMDWDASVFPHAWFWHERHASSGFPWFRRAYVVAVEPANVLPGEGAWGEFERGATDRLPGVEPRPPGRAAGGGADLTPPGGRRSRIVVRLSAI